MVILTFFISFSICTAIFTVTGALIVLILREKLESISFGVGPELINKQLGSTTIKIHWIPIGGSVSFKAKDYQIVNEGSGALETEIGMARWKTLLILFGQPLITLILGIFLLGFHHSISVFLKTFKFVIPFINSVSYTTNILGNWFSMAANAQYSEFLGMMAVAMSSFNLLPIPFLNGGNIILNIFGNNLHIRTKEKISLTGFIVLTVLYIYWIWMVYKTIVH